MKNKKPAMEKEKRKLVVVVTITNEQISLLRRLVHSWLAVLRWRWPKTWQRERRMNINGKRKTRGG